LIRKILDNYPLNALCCLREWLSEEEQERRLS
jgi:hypothetical protein